MVYSLLQSYDKYRFTSRYIANSSRPYALYFRSVEELFSEKTQLFPIIGNPLLGNFSSREVGCLPEYGQRFAELFKREPFPVRLYIYMVGIYPYRYSPTTTAMAHCSRLPEIGFSFSHDFPKCLEPFSTVLRQVPWGNAIIGHLGMPDFTAMQLTPLHDG